jgi:hypothetical protein
MLDELTVENALAYCGEKFEGKGPKLLLLTFDETLITLVGSMPLG